MVVPRPRSGSRRAFTLIEVLVVVGCVALIAGLLLPAMGMVRYSAKRTACGSNQRQIVLAAVVYANDNEGAWPARPTGVDGSIDATCPPRATTAGSLELLVSYHQGEVNARSVSCPITPGWRPTAAVNDVTQVGSTSAWAVEDGLAPGCVPFAWDWTVPRNATASRVVLADRGPGHRTGVMAACADAHVVWISAVLPEVEPTVPLGAGLVRYRDASGDDIFSDVDDGTLAPYDSQDIGRGSTSRAWLR